MSMRIQTTIIFALAAFLMITSTPPTKAGQQPYAGQQNRPVKALSEQVIEGLKTGGGLGMAKTAELNRYPGPLHILELADKINLTDQQRNTVEALYRQMKAEAIPKGIKLIAAEVALEKLFSQGTVTLKNLKETVSKIARLKGELRVVHLKYHLKSKPLLTDQQLKMYTNLRGYSNGAHKKHEYGSH